MSRENRAEHEKVRSESSQVKSSRSEEADTSKQSFEARARDAVRGHDFSNLRNS